MFIYIIPLRSYIYIYHHSTWFLYIIICAYSTWTLTTLVPNLNQFSRIFQDSVSWRCTKKKKRCRHVLQIWHEKGKWTMATLPASQQRQSLPATAALPLAHQPVRRNLETPQFSVTSFTCSFGKKHHELFINIKVIQTWYKHNKYISYIQDLKNIKSHNIFQW